MSNVCELFSEAFTYVRRFEQQSLHGDFQPPYAEVRGTIVQLLQQQDVAVKQQGMLEHEYQEARFAVVTWIDETILQYTDWQHYDQWNTMPLQLEFYQTRQAGEEVLARLERLSAEQKEMRELYYQCFDLKLIGRYFLSQDDPPVQTPPAPAPEQPTSISVLVPGGMEDAYPDQPRDLLRPGDEPVAGRLGRQCWDYLVRGVLGLLLLALFWPWSGQPERVSEPRLPTQPAPASAGVEAGVRQWFAQQQELLQCSSVTVDAVVAANGRVQVGGRIASETQRAAISRGIQGVPGVKQVGDTLQLVPWPFCAALDLLEPFAGNGQTTGLAMRLNKAGERPVYYAKENLLVEVQNPGTAERYVYIDYYTTDQAVWHVFPNPWEPQHRVPPQSTLTVGAVNGPSPWKIAPPFGLELVTVVTSAVPLFPQARYGLEPAAGFLSVLRQAMANADAEVRVAFVFVVTQEHP